MFKCSLFKFMSYNIIRLQFLKTVLLLFLYKIFTITINITRLFLINALLKKV